MMFRRVTNASAAILDGILIVALSALAFSVFAQVIMRYLLSAPPFWTEELARFLLIWITFAGIVSLQATHGHIQVNWLTELLTGRARTAMMAIQSAIVLCVLGFITKAGFDIAAIGQQTSPALGVSMRYIYGALPFGASLAAIVVAVQLAGQIRSVLAGTSQEKVSHDN